MGLRGDVVLLPYRPLLADARRSRRRLPIVNEHLPLDGTIAAIVLAAGKGTRMKSDLPKVLHRLSGKSMINHIVDTLANLGFGSHSSSNRPVLVVGFGADQVRDEIGDRATYVLQEPQLGTGHAAAVGLTGVGNDTTAVLLIHGDEPLISLDTYRSMLDCWSRFQPAIVLLTGHVEDTQGLGRVIRGPDGEVLALVQEQELTKEQQRSREINFGAYVFDRSFLDLNLPLLKRHEGGEYYLTDLVTSAVDQGRQIKTISVPHPNQQMGVNDREQLSRAERYMQVGS